MPACASKIHGTFSADGDELTGNGPRQLVNLENAVGCVVIDRGGSDAKCVIDSVPTLRLEQLMGRRGVGEPVPPLEVHRIHLAIRTTDCTSNRKAKLLYNAERY